MAVMQNTLLSATGSFGLQSAESLAKKAMREYERANQANNDENRRDAVINCAMTTWHIVDWAWSGLADLGRNRPAFMQLLGVSGRNASKTDLIAWATQQCPELNVCQSICNGTKHVQSTRPIRTEMKSDPSGTEVNRLIFMNDQGQEQDVLPVLLAAVTFWAKQSSPQYAMR